MIKFLMFRLSFRDDIEAGLLTADTAEKVINGHLSQGWKVTHVTSAGYNENGTQMVIVLEKPVAAAK